MRAVKAYPSNNSKTRGIVIFSVYAFITTGTREYMAIPQSNAGICLPRDDLMEECVRLTQQKLRGTPTVKKRAKTVYSQRNLGTIRERKKEKRQDNQQGNGDMILRILRMRYVASSRVAETRADTIIP